MEGYNLADRLANEGTIGSIRLFCLAWRDLEEVPLRQECEVINKWTTEYGITLTLRELVRLLDKITTISPSHHHEFLDEQQPQSFV